MAHKKGTSPPTAVITLGGRDISHLVQNLQTKHGVGAELGEATLALDAAKLVTEQLDWQGELIIEATEPTRVRLFTGVVEDALPVHVTPTPAVAGTTVSYAVRCVGQGVILRESRLGATAHVGMPAADVLHLILQQANWPRDRREIQGDGDLPLETFEVIAPLEGVTVASPQTVGQVRLHPKDEFGITEELAQFDLPTFTTMAERASAWAVVHLESRLTVDALDAGTSRIDVALAWLGSRAQDGTIIRAGNFWPYRRNIANATMQRLPLTYCRGIATGRLWITTPGVEEPATVNLTTHGLWSAPPLPRSIDPAHEYALLAWARAKAPGPFERRVQALWDCLEYYGAAARVPHFYTPEQVEALVDAIATVDLPPDLAPRAIEGVRKLNDPPLMVKIRHVAEADGGGLSVEEGKLLQRLRRARNDVSHGKAPAPERAEDLRHALSIVARLLAARGVGAHRRHRSNDRQGVSPPSG